MLGAAGCGYEYESTVRGGLNQGYKCSHLNETDKEFDCSKHHAKLKKHRITGHPFRCNQCKRGKSE